MVDGQIIVPLKQELKDDGYVDVGFKTKNERQKIRKKIIAKEQEFVKKHKPYCFRCAYADLQEKQEQLFKRGKGGKAKFEEDVKVDLDLESYGKISRFKLLSESPVREHKLIDGIKTFIETALLKRFRCKERGCSIKVQTDLLEEKNANK